MVADGASEAARILARTRRTLRDAELALDELRTTHHPERRSAAFRNVVIHGRAVTNVLQGLRSKVKDFDAWYGSWRREMEQDPLLKYLYRLRTSILKRGEDLTGSRLHIEHLDTSDLPPAPDGAESFFVGDTLGGVGWRVRREDGSVHKVYYELPESVGRSWLVLGGCPDIHLGDRIKEQSAEHVSGLYVAYLRRLVDEAGAHFAAAMAL